jgi:hypothetical protein
MAYNYQPIKYLSADGVFHTDGIGVNPNDPSAAYRSLNSSLDDTILLDNTHGKVVLTELNQKAQLNTTDTLATRDEFDESRAYGTVLRQSS